MTAVVAVDLRGTKTAAALVDHDGTILARATTLTAARSCGEVAAIGVGSAGVIDPRSGMVVSATAAILGWAGTSLAGGLRERLGLGVAVDLIEPASTTPDRRDA